MFSTHLINLRDFLLFYFSHIMKFSMLKIYFVKIWMYMICSANTEYVRHIVGYYYYINKRIRDMLN